MREADTQDLDRLRLAPERRLRSWEATARPIAELADVPLTELGREIARSVLVYPQQSLDAAGLVVDRIAAATPHSPEERAPIADAINALACVGVAVPDAEIKLANWRVGLTAVEPPFPGRLSAGFAALAMGDDQRARYVAPVPYDVTGGAEFRGDVHALLGYGIWALRNGGILATMEQALGRMAEELDILCASNQLDEGTVLWIARFAYHRLGGVALADVAARAHELLWKAPAELARSRALPVEPPIGATLGGGAFRIEHRLRGVGMNLLYRGVEVATGAPLQVALSYFRSKHDVDELRAAVSYDAPGLLELVHVGLVDGTREYWAIVERAAGTWLPYLVGPAEPWTAPRKAIELGLAAGRILAGALHLGSALWSVRPDVVWGRCDAGRYTVTGLSTRCFQLFMRSYQDAFTHPLFVHHYRDPSAYDERALVFSLSVMIAEWAMGTYPLHQRWGVEAITHMPLEVPAPLRQVLERGLAPARTERPSLATFLEQLEHAADQCQPYM